MLGCKGLNMSNSPLFLPKFNQEKNKSHRQRKKIHLTQFRANVLDWLPAKWWINEHQKKNKKSLG